MPPSPSSSVRSEAETPGHLPLRGFFLLGSLALFWGVNWPAMKAAVSVIEPWTFRSLCLISGAVGLMTIATAKRLSLRIPRADFRPLILAALLNITAWQLFSAFGLTLMEAGRASLIAFTMPLWAAILSVMILRERMDWMRILGLAFGLGGLVVLLAPDLGRMSGTPWGALLMLGAAVTWAAGTVLVKAVRWQMDAVRLTAWQLAIGSLPVLVGTIFLGRPASLLEASGTSLVGAIYAMLIPMIYCHYAWFRIVEIFPANVAAVGTLAIPVVGLFSSALLLGEPLGMGELAALALVIGGLFMVLIVPATHSFRRAKRTA